MKKTVSTLNNLYYHLFSIPRWTHLISLSEDYDDGDLKCLEALDTYWLKMAKESELLWKIWERAQKTDLEEGLKKEIGESYCREREIAFLEKRRKELIRQIIQIYENYEDSIKKDSPYFLRRAVLQLNEPRHLEKELRYVGIKLSILKNLKTSRRFRKLTSEEIINASKYPFENLIKFNQAGFAFCPFHKEKKPSFHLIKGSNYAFCFGCNWKGNPINFIMKLENLSFSQAVKKLNKNL